MKLHLAIMVLLVFVLAACAPATAPATAQEQTAEVAVAATFYPYYDLTRQIVGDVGTVNTVVPATTEPHGFNPSARDIADLQDISVYVATGVEFEAFEDTIMNALPAEVAVIEASAGIELLEAGDDHHHDDEHEGEHADEHHDEEHKDEEYSHDDEHSEEEHSQENEAHADEHHDEEHSGEEHAHDEENAEEGMHTHADGQHSHDEHEIEHDIAQGRSYDGDEDGYSDVASHGDEHDEHDEEHSDEEHADDNHDEEKHDDHNHGGTDPHVWLSPVNAQVIAQNIYDGLVAAHPEHEAELQANLNTLLADLEALDQAYETSLMSCEADIIMVTHNAYQYLAEEYDFEVLSISGLSPESEPTPGQLAELIDEAEYHNLGHIFFEELVSPRVAEVIAQEVGAETLTINPVAGSVNDVSYQDIMQENLEQLQIGLQCS